MKKSISIQLLFTISICCCVATLNAQDTTKKASTAALNKQLGMYVFPAKSQTAEQQQKDEKECYDWAVKNSGVDPLNLQKVEAAQAEKTRGGAVSGAAKGAAAGAAIGAIAGDAGTGAGVGAAAGAMAGRRAKKKSAAQQEQKAQSDANTANQEQINSYKKAYTACLTGKGYTVQ